MSKHRKRDVCRKLIIALHMQRQGRSSENVAVRVMSKYLYYYYISRCLDRPLMLHMYHHNHIHLTLLFAKLRHSKSR